MAAPADPLYSEPGNYQMSNFDQLRNRKKQNYIRSSEQYTQMQNACGKYLTSVMAAASQWQDIQKYNYIHGSWTHQTLTDYEEF